MQTAADSSDIFNATLQIFNKSVCFITTRHRKAKIEPLLPNYFIYEHISTRSWDLK